MSDIQQDNITNDEVQQLLPNETITINNLPDPMHEFTINQDEIKISVSNTPVSRNGVISRSINNPLTTPLLTNMSSSRSNSKNNSRRPSKTNDEVKDEIKTDTNDVRIHIDDADYNNLQNVDLNELVKNLSNRYASKPLTPIKENKEEVSSPALSTTSTHTKAKFQDLKNNVLENIIVPSYIKDIKGTVSSRGKWRNSGNKAELISKVLTGAATIVAFAAGAYTDITYLSFIAGCIGTGAMVCQQFSTYAKSESKERTDQANKILKVLKIDTLPDLDSDDE